MREYHVITILRLLHTIIIYGKTKINSSKWTIYDRVWEGSGTLLSDFLLQLNGLYILFLVLE